MKLFSNLRSGITNLVIKRLLRTRKRHKKVYNLSTARSIGIVFDGTNPKNFDGVFDFYKKLKIQTGIRLSVLGYINPDSVPNKFLIRNDVSFFSTNDVNWYYKPGGQDVVKFCNDKLDILINLDLNRQKPINFISSVSIARFKVGRYHSESKFNDFSIRIDSEPTLEFFIQQVEHYLELINRPDLAPKFQNV